MKTRRRYTSASRCSNCGRDAPPYNAGLCEACRRYKRKNGTDRPYGDSDGRRRERLQLQLSRREAEALGRALLIVIPLLDHTDRTVLHGVQERVRSWSAPTLGVD